MNDFTCQVGLPVTTLRVGVMGEVPGRSSPPRGQPRLGEPSSDRPTQLETKVYLGSCVRSFSGCQQPCYIARCRNLPQAEMHHRLFIGICKPGTASVSGFQPCFTCEYGFYQDMPGQNECKKCPAGQTTKHLNSAHSSDCVGEI